MKIASEAEIGKEAVERGRRRRKRRLPPYGIRQLLARCEAGNQPPQ